MNKAIVFPKRLLVVIIIFVAPLLFFSLYYNRTSAAEEKVNPAASCDQQVAMLNSRSALLGQYKKSESNQYKAIRKKWTNRIAYAGQWVPKDAEKSRETVYKYDSLEKALTTEIDKQIPEFKSLEQKPIDCSEAKKSELQSFLEKASQGQKKLKESKTELEKYLEQDFKKSTEKMVDKLHSAKEGNPKPEKSMTIVKEPQ